MPLIPLSLPPGFYRNGTEFQSSGRWRDGSLVRWRDGGMGPVGGWAARTSSTTNAAPRGAIAWQDNAGDRRIAFGTFSKLYSLSASGTLSDITPSGFTSGQEDATLNTGYGGSFYGKEDYGTSRSDTGSVDEATTWALDTFGQYLVGCAEDDGKLYEWQLDTGTPAAAISNAPTSNIGLVVTPERFLFALGAGGDARKVQWCDQGVNTTWTAASTNQAGDQLLQTDGVIQLGITTRGQTVILTTTDAHTASYLGPPFVYGFERVGTSCGAISRKCAASTQGGVYWMGNRSFYRYAGGAAEEIPCEVADYVFDNINQSQRSKIHAVANSQFGEIWWFYPSANSTECDSYVALNYVSGFWLIGSLDRTTGVDRGTFANPIWADSSGNIYDQELGWSHGSESVFAESGPISLGNGDQVMSVTNMYPDEETQGEVTATFKTRFYPNGTEREFGPFSMSNPTSVRFTGRQVRMLIEDNTLDEWRVGVTRLDAVAGGKR